MNTENDTQRITAACKEQWILHSIPFMPGTSNVGLNEDFFKDAPDAEELGKVIKIWEQREGIKSHQLVTAVIGEEDFLPLSFLQQGAKQGAAVCRIARYFSLSSFKEFIEMIQEVIVKWGTAENFNTAAKLKEIFLLPDSVAQDIFSLPNPVENNAPWNEIQDADKLLNNLQALTDSQLAKINPIPIGTGFLVGGTHLLTNQHVLPSAKIAEQCVAQFNYEDDEESLEALIDYEFDPKALFVSEPSLDYTLVQLKSGAFTRQAGYRMGWIQLIEDDAAICPGLFYQEASDKKPLPSQNEGLWSDSRSKFFINVQTEEQKQAFQDWSRKASGDSVYIIQHPKGRRKQIVMVNNKVIDYGLFKNFLRYRANTDYGSSGSPVFNGQWQLVALHHAAIPKIVSKEADHYGKEKDQPAEIIAQQGVRICRIVADLKQKSFRNPKLKSFIEDFVITAEQLNYPPLPAVARLNGGVSGQKNGYFDCGNHESLDVSESITCEAWIAKLDDENGMIFRRNEDKNEYVLWCFDGKIRAQVRSEGMNYIVDTKKPAPQDGLWHHVAFTWSKSQETQIYIDGEKQEPKYGKDDRTPLETPIGKINRPVCIGGESEQEVLGGDIAEVRLWKTVRSQAQIKETMYRRLTGDHSKEGLIGYWQFEEDKASKTYVYNLAALEVGSNVPSIDLFTRSAKIQPQFGLELNGKTDYIDCGSFAIEKAVTFEAWVQRKERNQTSFIAAQGGCWGGQGYSVWWDNDRIAVELQGDQTEIHAKNYVPIPIDNDWHHIAFTWSSELPNICVYIDGKGVHSNKESFAGPIGLSRMNLCIGRNKAITNYYFKGSIAEARLWKVARSEEQINDAMNKFISDEIKDDHLVGYWRLDEQTGNEATNLDGKGQPGVVYGGRWLKAQYAAQNSRRDYGVPFGDVKWLKASECSASLPLPSGLKFNDKDDQVNCGQDPSLNVTNAITVEAWLKHQFGNCLIVSRGGYVKDGYSLCWRDGKIRVMLLDKTTNQKMIVDTKENAPIDQVWHHIAFTWDTTSQEIFIYVDGRQQDCVVMEGQTKSIVHAGQTKSTALFTGSLADLKADLVIGCNTNKEQYYNVMIAEVRLWKVVRTQDQIKTNMTCRLSRRDDDWQYLLAYWRLDDGGEGNTQARNLKSDSNHGLIQGTRWFPAPPASASLSQPLTSTENSSIPTPSG
ncbi:MAG: LamG-like jellyroll fold domain-containing protein [Nostoc sp.]|uniref:LamG-like jellyroll fold domain-containing protein n=1 Tax=Nostoc sp. TaxID=1180 RepID=UPI002FFA8F1D